MLILADTRERAVLPFITASIDAVKEKLEINFVVEQINTGDYIIASNDQILLCVERKTHEDLAASLKDGRYQNKEKMITYREKTGCKLMFIIEGKVNPSPEKRFARIPYKYLKAAEDHLMLRDNIFVVYSESLAQTAKFLVDYALVYSKILEEDAKNLRSIKVLNLTHTVTTDDILGAAEATAEDIAEATAEDIAEATAEDIAEGVAKDIIENDEAKPDISTSTLKELKTIIEKPNDVVIVACWTSLPFISFDVAKSIASQYSIKEFITSEVDYNKFKTRTGRNIGANSIKSLQSLNAAKLLSGIPRLTEDTAKKILSFRRFVEFDDTIAEINIGTFEKPRKLGKVMATKILNIMNVKNEYSV
jgi:ERCC4-type nuclease